MQSPYSPPWKMGENYREKLPTPSVPDQSVASVASVVFFHGFDFTRPVRGERQPQSHRHLPRDGSNVSAFHHGTLCPKA